MNSSVTEKPIVATFVRNITHHYHHWHEDMVLLYVLKGEIKVKLWYGESVLRKDDIVVINEYQIHQLEGVTPNNRVLIIHFNRLFCEQIMKDFNSIVFYCDSAYQHNNDCKFQVLRQYILFLLPHVKCNELRRTDRCKANIEYLCRQIICYLAEHFDYISCGQKNKKFEDATVKRYKKIFKYIFEAPNNVSLQELAHYMNISPHYLSRDISNKFGFTYQNLKGYLMVERAFRRVVSTEKRILDICYESGFSDPKYLTRYFKECYGCTPSRLRQYYKDSTVEKERFNEYSLVDLTIDTNYYQNIKI